METLRELKKRINNPIIRKIERQFGNLTINTEINPNLSDAEIFRRLSNGHGQKKSHCSRHFPKDEWKLKGS